MPSQLELLKAALVRLEPKHGVDNPYVRSLKEQIVGLENQLYRREQRKIQTLKPSINEKL